MKRYILLSPLLMISLLGITWSQEINLENLTVLPFEGWSGATVRAASEYQNALTDKITTRIIKTHRFNVIDRGNLEHILQEQDLQLTGLTDESSAVRIGQVAGAQKMIVGSFTRNSTEYHKAQYYEGEKIKDAYYDAHVQATIRMLDIETATYLEAAEAAGTGTGPDERNALLNALDALADSVMIQFEKYFAIQAYITSVDKATVILDRGAAFGVKDGMDFAVYDIRLADHPGRGTPVIEAGDELIGVLRIVTAEARSARGRLMVGFGEVESGHLVRETKVDIPALALVVDKEGANVLINAGRDLGITDGTTFDVLLGGRTVTDPVTGQEIRVSPETVGVLYITDSGPNSSRGKIIKGVRDVEAGMWIQERKSSTVSVEASLLAGPLRPSIEANPISGTYTVENKYTGSHEITIDYTDVQEITNGFVIRVSGSRRDLVNKFSVGVGLDWFLYSDELSAVAFDLWGSYNIELVPEKIYFSPGLAVSYGIAFQKLPSGIISTISDDQSKVLTSTGIPVMPQAGLHIRLGQATLSADVGYRLWSATEWSYEVKTGGKTESGEDKTAKVELNPDLIPYPKVSVGGMYFMIGLSIEDLWSRISGAL